jgi:hypothetical protein
MRTSTANKHPPALAPFQQTGPAQVPVFFRPPFSSRLQVRSVFGVRSFSDAPVRACGRPGAFGCGCGRSDAAWCGKMGGWGVVFSRRRWRFSRSVAGGCDMRAVAAVSDVAGIWAPIHGANGTAGAFRPFKRHTPAPRRMRAAPPTAIKHTMLQLLLLLICCKKGKNRRNPLISLNISHSSSSSSSFSDHPPPVCAPGVSCVRNPH